MSSEVIFVFGSNEAGAHGGGAALYAHRFNGAEMGVGVGRTGSAYAIPTKDRNIETLPLSVVKNYVDDFIDYAKANPKLVFKVTAIGCGLAGFTHAQIAPLFKGAPQNCLFDDAWKPYLGTDHRYWGTF